MMESSPSAAVLSPNTYYSSLDFFSLVGLDGHTPNNPDTESPAAPAGQAPAHSTPAPYPKGDHSQYHTPSHSASHSGIGSGGHDLASPVDEPLDDPSPISLDVTQPPAGSGRQPSPTPHHPSQSSQSSTQPGSRRASRSSISTPVKHWSQGAASQEATSMDVDHNAGDAAGRAVVSGSGHSTPALDATEFMQMHAANAAYDSIQAGILQRQLESIHMQSPFMNPNNPVSPYTMAQMFLTSPPGNTSGDAASTSQSDANGRFGASSMSGVLTPGPSGDIHPDMRMDLSQFQTVPLLSPALSHSASSFSSPVANVAFNTAKDVVSANQHALEQLQVQQRQFQEQLAQLQEQQRQLQATAAAVAAASGSPFMGPQQQQSQQQRLNAAQVSSGSGQMTTPSPGSYFSPLTSPALEPAVSRSATLRAAAAHLSPALHSQHQPRPPRTLSALSSPALNPVGSSGGAQQTLSPAFVPQTSVDGADPDYLHVLQGIIDGSGPSEVGYQSSPIISPTYPNPPSGMNGGSSGSVTGPHRGSLSQKSRPSPMMKPTNHRSHVRGSSASVPTSPMAFKVPQAGMGFLPPAAIDQRGVQQQQQQQAAQANSTFSTPSPVDTAQIMPPPPVPNQGARPKSLMPMTPATLMNLGKPEMEAESSKAGAAAAAATKAAAKAAIPPPVRSATKKGAPAIAPASQQPATKRGSRLVPSGGAAAAKRALAIRPPGGVGVRTATEGAAAAAAAAAGNTEPESRRTSHKAAEQKRRDSLKAGFDELRLLLPAINTEALDPESGEPIPGSSAPRLLPKSSLVPDDNPNRGVSKVALLKFSNEYIVRLHNKVEKRDAYIDKLRDEVRRLRVGDGSVPEVRGDEGEDLLDMDMLEGEEDDLGGSSEGEDGHMDVDGDGAGEAAAPPPPSKKKGAGAISKSPALGPTRRPPLKTTKRRMAANE